MRKATPFAWTFTALVFTWTGDTRAEEETAAASWPRVEIWIAKTGGRPTLETQSVNGWTPVRCTLPCVRRLDPVREYRVAGDGLVTSEAFRLPVGASQVKVTVEGRSALVRDTAIVAAVVGALMAAGGTSAVFAAADDDREASDKRFYAVAGASLLTIGLTALTLGTIVALGSDPAVRVVDDSGSASR